jgi:MFS family permease
MPEARAFSSLPKQFYLFQSGIICGYFAVRLAVLGTSWWCLTQTHSSVQLASVISASVVLELFAGPLAAPLGDRFGSKLVTATFVLQTICLIALASAALLLKSFSLLVAAPLLVITQLADAARDPLADSLLPQLIGDEALVDGERIRRALGTASRILGPVVGGALTAFFGPPITLYLAAFAVVVGGYMCATSGAGRFKNNQGRQLPASAVATLSDWANETVSGFKSVLAIRTELLVACGNAFLTVAVGTFMFIALPQLASNTYGAWVVGAVDGAFGLGVFVSAAFSVKRINIKIGRYEAVLLGLLIHGAAFAVLYLGSTILPLIVTGGFALGFAAVLVATNLTALRLQATPPEFRTRIVANTTFISSIFLPGGLFLSGWISQWAGLNILLACLFVCSVLATAIIPCAPHLKSLLKKDKQEGDAAYATLFPDAFSNQ